MNWVDFLVIGVVFVSMLIGVIRGLVKEALTLVSWVTSIWVAWHFYPYLVPHLSGWINDASLRVLAAVTVLFLLSLVVLTALSYLLTRLMEQTGLSGINRSLGALFGIARGVLAISLVVMLATLTPIVDEQWWRGSMVLPYFTVLTEWLQLWLPVGITSSWATTA